MARWSRFAPDADRRLVKGLHDGDDDVIATLYDRIVQPHGHGRRMLMACVGREIHQLGARMVADFAEMEGWDVIFLGTVRSPEPERITAWPSSAPGSSRGVASA